MADKQVNNTYAYADASDSVRQVKSTAVALTAGDKIIAKDFFKSKDNSAYLVINVTTAGTGTIKAGDTENGNTLLGDMAITLAAGMHFIAIERDGRFENKDGSLIVETATAVGSVYVVSKHAGLLPVANQ